MLIAARVPRTLLAAAAHCERALVIRLGFRLIGLGDLSAISPAVRLLSLVPPFIRCFDRRDRFANAAPSVVELADFRMGTRQI